jgi:hypothetical protein
LSGHFSNEEIQVGKYIQKMLYIFKYSEIKMKTILIIHFTPSKMAIIKKTTSPKQILTMMQAKGTVTYYFGNVSYKNHFLNS